MIIHIPHASSEIPAEVREQFVVSDQALSAELLRSTDWYTDELFAADNDPTVQYPISRLVVDPERFEADAEESMAKVGRGVVYHSCTDGAPLRRKLSASERHSLLETFYRPHHRALEEAAEQELARSGKAMIVDAHSFPDVPWPIEPSQEAVRPDFCLGSDPFHTPPEMVEEAIDLLRRSGFSVFHNQPYGGTFIPARYYRRNPRVYGLMVEVNRRLYMDEESGRKKESFSQIEATIDLLCRFLAAWPASGLQSPQTQAASSST